METKSRYEVISELEAKKRSLIEKRDALGEEIYAKKLGISDLERQKEDIDTHKKDFDIKEQNKIADLERERKDFEFKIKNTETKLDRQIEDAKKDLELFESELDAKKKTYGELIKGVNESLERFASLKEKSKS